jgi:isoleucyl-tRNA synthetase
MSNAPENAGTKPDYRHTVFLPKTDFPMKAGLPQKEPAILARWEEADLYNQVRKSRDGREKFILHDGPPYANGDIHIGHALNHILKDMVVRTQTLLGKDAPYVPGWDCHGLPIEWKVEEQYRKKKLNKDEVPVREFRAECRAYAQNWVDVQREQLKRLGIGGRWDKPYLTMNYEAEGTIVAELMKFAESGQLYRGAKPVMWSPVEKTALAEAEIEYEDIVSTQIDVAFEIVDSPIEELKGAHAVVWTTTPWTIPVNQAIAYGPDVEYVLVRVGVVGADDTETNNLDRGPLDHLLGQRFVVAKPLVEAVKKRLLQANHAELFNLQFTSDWQGVGRDLAGTIARHPIYNLLRHSRESGNPASSSDELDDQRDSRFRGSDADWERALAFFAKPRPFLPGDFVTTDTGTGLVHMAPDHGEDDFDLCKANGIDPVFAVEADGKYRADWAWLGGQGSVINNKFTAPEGPICSDLREAGALLAASEFRHSYPHSWRSKAKVIYRCTPQWFIAMDRPRNPLPHAGGEEVRSTEGEGLSGSHSISPPASGRGETLRQLALDAISATRWVPEKGENRIRSMVEGRPDWVISRQRAWGVPIALFVERSSGQLLVDADVNHRIVEAVKREGVDAWCDENADHFLGPNRDPEDFERVTDILDVWFDSGCTHAFTLESGAWPELSWPADLYLEGSDQHRGWFQSSLLESCGTRGRAPYKAVLTHGFTMDSKGMKMSKSLGNTISPLDLMKDSYTRLLSDFANNDLSAFYFDIRKDCLYCDAPSDPKRRAYRTVLDTLFHALVRWCAPVLVFTSEEVWGTRFPDGGSVHLLEWPELPLMPYARESGDPAPVAPEKQRDSRVRGNDGKWEQLRALRTEVTEAIEPLRREKVVGSSLEAEVTLPAPDASIDLAELFIVSSVTLGDALAVTKTDKHKCGRCWRHLSEVNEDGDLCNRCDTVVNG